MGVLLSLALFFILGIGLVFFGKQLLDSWRRRHPPAGVARFGSDREHHWGLDVRSICKLFGCDRDAASGAAEGELLSDLTSRSGGCADGLRRSHDLEHVHRSLRAAEIRPTRGAIAQHE